MKTVNICILKTSAFINHMLHLIQIKSTKCFKNRGLSGKAEVI